jgi:hypothetical protein
LDAFGKDEEDEFPAQPVDTTQTLQLELGVETFTL